MATVADYRSLPETGPRFELVEGRLFKLPSMDRYAHDIRNVIFFRASVYLDKHKSGVIYAAPLSVYLDEFNAYQPDILFVSNENKILTDEGVEGGPDFIVQILLPGTGPFEQPKRRVYARCGVNEYWFINPQKKTIKVYFLQRSAETPMAAYSNGDIINSPHFSGLKFSVSEIFKQQ